MAKDVDIDTSETSSYHSSDNEMDKGDAADVKEEPASAPAEGTERSIEESKVGP